MDERRDLVDREELRQAMAEAIAFAHLVDPDPDPAVVINYERCADAVLAVPGMVSALGAEKQLRAIRTIVEQSETVIATTLESESRDNWRCAVYECIAAMLRGGEG